MRGAYDKRQGGYALLLMLVTLMGIGGLVATDFTRDARLQAERERYLHNQRVLREAKRALLMYAYNYPNIVVPAGSRGPGRLPCPDADNDGVPEVLADCSNAGPVPVVGRFPWAANGMNLYDIRDASGQRLWYAVSSSFDFGDADVINAGTAGTITIHDQNNRLLHDNGLDGIAAVIIAPGPIIDRAGVPQDRSIGNGDDPGDLVADTDPGIVNPVNYLDFFGGRDNSDFDNTVPSDDGFILGPIYDANGNVRVNDQMILITAEEVTRVAQRAALETYRGALGAWQQAIWGGTVANYRYPWLNDFDDVAALGDLDIYEVDPAGDSAGRVPFLNYFDDHDSHTAIMDLVIDYDIDFNLNDSGPDGGAYVDAFDNAVGAQQLSIQNAYVSIVQREPGGANNSTDDLGTLRSDASLAAPVTTLLSPPSITRTLFFWDGCASCDLPQTTWQLCQPPATSETDCARDNDPPHNPEPWDSNWDDHADIRIRFVRLRFDVDAEFEIGLDFSQATVPNPPLAPTAAASARRVTDIQALLLGPAFPTYIDLAVDEGGAAGQDADFIHIEMEACEQDNFVGSNYNVPSFNPDTSSYDCAGDITLDDTPVINQFDLAADFYPELPVWVRDNFWNDSILFAYAPAWAPDAPPGLPDCLVTTPPCLTVGNEFDGTTTGNIALLIGANDQPGVVGDYLSVTDPIFDPPNNVPQEEDAGGNPDAIYDANPPGNDTLLIVNEN